MSDKQPSVSVPTESRLIYYFRLLADPDVNLEFLRECAQRESASSSLLPVATPKLKHTDYYPTSMPDNFNQTKPTYHGYCEKCGTTWNPPELLPCPTCLPVGRQCGKEFETICNKPQGHKGLCGFEPLASLPVGESTRDKFAGCGESAELEQNKADTLSSGDAASAPPLSNEQPAKWEFRPDCEEMQKPAGMGQSLDEVVAEKVETFHLERMDNNCYWMGLDLAGGRSLRLIIAGGKRSQIHAYGEDEGIQEPYDSCRIQKDCSKCQHPSTCTCTCHAPELGLGESREPLPQLIPCEFCGTTGQVTVSPEMAIDAGNPELAGSKTKCWFCNGEGIKLPSVPAEIENTEDWLKQHIGGEGYWPISYEETVRLLNAYKETAGRTR